ncbi:RxLR effector protein [Phytophthora megakarya]|uniref:RxLR effector protein n=1 Tax=Phytophthora megakarya TaxID=4795 RepID=A0A225V9I6_9STRA|nr:RxLR effector protein [Phytophthora megakarya]
MRLQYVFLVTIVGLVAGCGDAIAVNSKTVSVDSAISVKATNAQSNEDTQRLLRTSKTTDVAGDEERGIRDAVEKGRITALKAKIPLWILQRKSQSDVQELLGMAGVYPLINHKNWKVLKSFMKAERKVHNSLHPGT